MNVIQCSNNPYYALFLVWMEKSCWRFMVQRLAFLCCVATISIHSLLEDEGSVQFSSVTQSCPTLCDLMNRSRPGFPVLHQHPVYPNSWPSNRWCHPAISSPVIPFSSCYQSFPASGSFLLSQFFASGGQSIGASASAQALPMNIHNRFPLGLTGLISLQSKRLSKVFSNTTVQKPQFSVLSFLYSPALKSIHDYWKNHSFD